MVAAVGAEVDPAAGEAGGAGLAGSGDDRVRMERIGREDIHGGARRNGARRLPGGAAVVADEIGRRPVGVERVCRADGQAPSTR